jgi:hypothetical protein
MHSLLMLVQMRNQCLPQYSVPLLDALGTLVQADDVHTKAHVSLYKSQILSEIVRAGEMQYLEEYLVVTNRALSLLDKFGEWEIAVGLADECCHLISMPFPGLVSTQLSSISVQQVFPPTRLSEMINVCPHPGSASGTCRVYVP